MPITKTEICNMALGMLGAQLLADFDTDTNTTGVLCRLFYPTAIKVILEDMPWTFATKRASLTTPVVSTPIFGYATAFQLPDDFIQIIETDPEEASWQIEGTLILTDQNTLGIRYVYSVEDTALLSAHVVQALSAKMAALLAMPVTRNLEITDAMLKVYTGFVTLARGRDTQQESRRTYGRDSLINVRY